MHPNIKRPQQNEDLRGLDPSPLTNVDPDNSQVEEGSV
jgi:hypothetical protein